MKLKMKLTYFHYYFHLTFKVCHVLQQRCQLLLMLKLDKKPQRGDQRIFWLEPRNISNGDQILGLFWQKNSYYLLTFFNNIKISTLDTINVIKISLKSVQFSELSKIGQSFRKLDGWQRCLQTKSKQKTDLT
jgi:hypothetical protein